MFLVFVLPLNVSQGLSSGSVILNSSGFAKGWQLFPWHRWFISFKPSFMGLYSITCMTRPLTKCGSTEFITGIPGSALGAVTGQAEPCWEAMEA